MLGFKLNHGIQRGTWFVCQCVCIHNKSAKQSINVPKTSERVGVMNVMKLKYIKGMLPKGLTHGRSGPFGRIRDFIKRINVSKLDQKLFIYKTGFRLFGNKHYLERNFNVSWILWITKLNTMSLKNKGFENAMCKMAVSWLVKRWQLVNSNC